MLCSIHIVTNKVGVPENPWYFNLVDVWMYALKFNSVFQQLFVVSSVSPARRKRRPTKLVRQHETAKNEALCHSRCGTIKIPPCSKIIGVEQQRSKFSIPSPSMVMSSWERNILEWDVTQETSKQERQLLRFKRGFEKIFFIYIWTYT